MAVLHVFWIVAGLFLLAGNLEARPLGTNEAQTVKLDQSELQRIPQQIRAIPQAQLGDFLQIIPNRQFGTIVQDLTSGQLTHVIKSIPDVIVGSIAQNIPDDELKELFIRLSLPTFFLKPAKNLPKDKLGGIVKALPNIGGEIKEISTSELGALAKKIPNDEIGKIAAGLSSDDIRDIIKGLPNGVLTILLQYLQHNFSNKPAVTLQSQNTQNVLLSDTVTTGGDAVGAVLGKVGLIDGLILGLQGILDKLPILGSPSISDGPLGLVGVLKGVIGLLQGLPMLAV